MRRRVFVTTIAAATLLAALPVVVLYLVAQRQLVSAFATSGVR